MPPPRPSTPKTFVGFGFGPIQSALFLLEAYRSGNFSRFVVSEVDEEMVAAVRRNGGRYTVNIARPDGISRFQLEGIEIFNPRQSEDRRALVEAIANSDEMATALPSVKLYPAMASLLREGLSRPAVIYAAENNNQAAEVLTEELLAVGCDQAAFQVLNTVIGKMSGVITDRDDIGGLRLATLTPDLPRAVLVEEFNRILISRAGLPGWRRGIDVLVEKDDLLPFEEAKLYGHNAIHALLAYLGEWRGLHTISDAANDEWLMTVARDAFINECGAALTQKYSHLKDPLFSEAGFAAYAEDLLERMTNPHLHDLISRVGRDQERKLGYDDRLFGAMRLVLSQGIQPERLALGAAAGVASLLRHRKASPIDIEALNRHQLDELLQSLWQRRDNQLVHLAWQAWRNLPVERL